MEFHSITLADKEWIKRALSESTHKSCEETFANLYTWGKEYGMLVCEIEGCLVTQYGERYGFPVGENAEKALCKVLDLYKTDTVEMYALEHENFPLLEKYCTHIRAGYERQWSDYLYESAALANLTGKRLAAKRNHINAFERDNPDWKTAPITPDNFEAVRRFHMRWASEREQDEYLKEELANVEVELSCYFDMDFEGLALYVGEEIVAYSYGEPVGKDTYCVHVEKALAAVRGAYPMINREFVRAYCMNYTYVNREDDSGEKGLRKAKLSYRPVRLVHKYEAKMEKRK